MNPSGDDAGTGCAGVVLSGDVAARGATFLDTLSPYTADQVAESLEQYAILHGRTWGRAQSAEPWLAPRLGRP